VYYIILDGYAREDVLETVYGFDNSEFIGWLRDQGFYVADQSVANYHKTVLSLPSSLNLNYLDEVGRRVSKDDRTRMSYHGLAQDHLVGRIFRSQGYRFVHFAAAYRATEDSAIADEVIRCYPRWMQSELAGVLSRTTALRPFGPKMARMHLHALEQLEAMPARPGPKFVFAHLILPHPPYVFDEHGNIRDDVPLDLDFEHVAGDRWSHQREYIHQLMYVNERMRVCLAAILAQSDPPPIIVLQSDHGPMSLAGRDPAALAASEPFIRERFPILNAYHVPDAMRESLYPEITPVNSFRVILNHLFLSEFELLDERCYYVLHDLSAGTEVTAIARRGAPSVDVVRSVQTSPGWSQAR
jgi:hypothetical protein